MILNVHYVQIGFVHLLTYHTYYHVLIQFVHHVYKNHQIMIILYVLKIYNLVLFIQ